MQEYLTSNNFDATALASHIAENAFSKSLDKSYFSPFAQEAAKEGYRFDGGKSDDITVVVGKVVLANI